MSLTHKEKRYRYSFPFICSVILVIKFHKWNYYIKPLESINCVNKLLAKEYEQNHETVKYDAACVNIKSKLFHKQEWKWGTFSEKEGNI